MDKLLEEAFTNKERWRIAIEKGLGKGINKRILREFCSERFRANLYLRIKEGRYKVFPPHIALIPKDEPGTFREVSVNEPPDRIIFSLFNDLLFDMCPQMVHPNCLSYQKGISCGDIVKSISKKISEYPGDGIIGWKVDLSKYFDSVPIKYIDAAFDEVERMHGKSAVISLLRDYYHSDLFFDIDNNLCEQYKSLKQGCAVASWLADVVLKHIDEILSNMDIDIHRYSDDMLGVGREHEKALRVLNEELGKMEMKLNPKKVEMIDRNHWVKFLGFSIKGSEISLSSNGIKKFQKAIEDATVDRKNVSYDKALGSVYKALYKGKDGHSWAARVLRTINVKHDIDILNGFVMDALRAVLTGKRRIGGLGYVKAQKNGCIARGKGKNVKANREKRPQLQNYYTIGCMASALKTSRSAFDAIVETKM